MKLNRKQLIQAAIISCLTASFTFSALAESTMEEIMVTATKRQQTLQEVPVAVSVTSADTIDKAKVQDILDLQSLVPSLRVTQLQSSTNTNFIIRGFGNGANNVGIEPSVGVFIDGVYRSRSAGAISDLPNMQRVEVLRGPQSTLFGKNASAGVISVITAKPDFELGGSAELTIGNYGLNIFKFDVTDGLTDKLAYSFSGNFNNRDGYFDNLAGGSDFNERDRHGFRGQLLYNPTDNSEFRLIIDQDSINENCCGVANLLNGPTGGVVDLLAGGVGLVPNSPFGYEGYFNKPSQSNVDNSGYSLQADIDFEAFQLTSITSYRDQEMHFNQDADFTAASLLGNVGENRDIQTITQEFRLTSNTDGNFDWLLGAFLFDESVYADTDALFGDDIFDYGNLLAGGLLPTLEFLSSNFVTTNYIGQFLVPGTGAREFSSQENTASSIYGQFDYHFNDRTTGTIGLNYTQDEKDVSFRQVNDGKFARIDLFTVNNNAIPNAFFGQEFFNATMLAPTPMNIAAISAAPVGAFLPNFPGSGAQLIGAIQAGVNDGIIALQGLQFLPPRVGYPNAYESGKSDDTDLTYTARIAYDATDNVNVYASIGTGFKATSWNLSRDSKPTAEVSALLDADGLLPNNHEIGTRFAGPEESTVFELGLKTRFDRGALNLAIFSQEIKGFQSNIFNGIGFNLANAGKQTTKGLEIDLTYDATDALTLSFAGTFLDPIYDSFVGASGVNGPEDLSGKQPGGIHEISTSTSATYNMEFSNGMTGFLRADYLYENNVPMLDNVSAELASRQVNTLNGSFGLETVNGWGFTLWGRNITNDQYLLSAFPSVAQAGSFSGYPNQPRTYGLSVKKYF